MSGIIAYDAWGRRSQGGSRIGPVDLVIVHHWWRPDIGADASKAREADALRGVEDFHASKGWGGATGYQFHAFASGRKWEGRGWRRSGAHTKGQNLTSVAIALPIDGDAHEPTDAQTRAVADVIRLGVHSGHIRAGYRVRGHRAYSSKSCPGGSVSDRWLRDLEGLDATPDHEPDETDEQEVDGMIHLWKGTSPGGTDGWWLVQWDLTAPSRRGWYAAVRPDELGQWQHRARSERVPDVVDATANSAQPSWFQRLDSADDRS